jgi:DNA-binding NtrC family response regulator
MAAEPSAQISESPFVYGLGAKLQALNARAAEIAATNIPVLLMGETGTGKDVYSRLIHRLSGGQESSFVRIGCWAMTPGTMLSDLHEAFPSGDEETRFKTLFLDGVEELDPECQRILLSLVPDGGERKGGVRISPRLICATSCDLEQEIETGRFRAELYFRISGAILHLPPLRERKEDIPYLLECFLIKYSIDLGRATPEIGREGRKLLFSHDWPGNIRELENVAHKIVVAGDANLALSDFRDIHMIPAVEPPIGVDGDRTALADIT